LGAKSAVEAGFERAGITATSLWLGVFAGPVGFAGAEFVNYTLAKWTCTHQTKLLLGGVTAAGLVLALGGLALAWRDLQRTPDDVPDDVSQPPGIARFMAQLGVILSTLSAVAILALVIPQWVLDACQ
jgi:hypothetical protein